MSDNIITLDKENKPVKNKKKHIEKNMLTCTPREFLTQCIKIKNIAANWVNVTKVLEIKQKVSSDTLKKVPEGATEEQTEEILKYNKKIYTENAEGMRKRFSAFLDDALIKYPDATLDLIAVLNFVDPAEIDDYEMGDFLESIGKMITDERIIGFFISLARVGQINF